jgi:transcriptional regulator with XRE-family HTH domain
MKASKSLIRQSHFLGTKIRNLRKRNNLTMEDLSARCVRVDPNSAPSVSYLSMIERGKRVPSVDMLEVIAAVFQKEPEWFLDDEPQAEAIAPVKSGSKGGILGMPLEPSFLFSPDILQIAIPELLTQAGVSGRQFAQLLIRAYQEHHQNHFPDLERAAEEVGKKQMPLSVEDMTRLLKEQGLGVRWFEQSPKGVIDELGVYSKNIISSYLEGGTLFLNEELKHFPTRLKYEMAVHIGHCVLHSHDGYQTVKAVGGSHGGKFNKIGDINTASSMVNAKNILRAWRSFESSFFAGALLCPRVPFRQLLDRSGYEISVHKQVQVSASVAMRRMTAVSPYSYWHYFDAYSPGKLKAVYRGNGIPLPWGNMRAVENPCPQWSVFHKIDDPSEGTTAQISILETSFGPRLYCCESIRVKDMAGNNHVLTAGVDLNPALETQGKDATEMAASLKKACIKKGGVTNIPRSLKEELSTVARILNINWIERGVQGQAHLICSKSEDCLRDPCCHGGKCRSD